MLRRTMFPRQSNVFMSNGSLVTNLFAAVVMSLRFSLRPIEKTFSALRGNVRWTSTILENTFCDTGRVLLTSIAKPTVVVALCALARLDASECDGYSPSGYSFVSRATWDRRFAATALSVGAFIWYKAHDGFGGLARSLAQLPTRIATLFASSTIQDHSQDRFPPLPVTHQFLLPLLDRGASECIVVVPYSRVSSAMKTYREEPFPKIVR